MASSRNHITHHYDNARTGWNPKETILTVNNVSSSNFGKLFEHQVDGDVYAQPLYVQNLNIIQKDIHNVVFIVTENNWIYAFDGDSNSDSNAFPLWSRNLCFPEVPVDNVDIPPLDGGCTDVNPHIGITSTPVIDLPNNIMYIVAKSKNANSGAFFQRLYAVDITSGNDRHAPVEIHGNDQGITFNTLMQFNRAALLLKSGVLYIAFACHCDRKPYYGWVMAYDVGNPGSPSFLNQIAVKNVNPTLVPDDEGGGIWMAGYGVSCDRLNNFYFTTGNGLFNANIAGGSSYGDSVVKMSLDSPNHQLNIVDYFTPSNQEYLRDQDLDLSSGGVMLIPDRGNRRLAISGGKDQVIFLLNRDSLGKYGGIHNKWVLQETAVGSTALTAVPNIALVMGWTGTDPQQHVNVATSTDASSISLKITMNEMSIDSPTLTFGNDNILVSWTGTDPEHRLNVVSGDNVQQFDSSPNKITLVETSPYGPTLSFGNALFFIAWTGTDSEQHLNIRSSPDGINFPDQSKITLNETSSDSPAISFIDGKLYLLWRGNDGNHSLNIMESIDGGMTFLNKRTFQDSSDFHPDLALHSDDLMYLVWTGRDPNQSLNSDNLERDTTTGFGNGNKMIFSDSSIAGPHLGTFNNNLYISWTGTDNQHHVNVATLEADRVVQRLPGVVGTTKTYAVFGGPAYYRGKDSHGEIIEYIYYCGNKDSVKILKLVNRKLSYLGVHGPDTFPGLAGATPCVSSNRGKYGTAIVWATTRGNSSNDSSSDVHIRLRAYDAISLSKLCDLEAGVWNKVVQGARRGNLYNSPTIINGKVYVASQNLLTVFGL